MQQEKLSISTGRLYYTMVDEDGDEFAKFYLNPTDMKLANRCAEVLEYFKGVEVPETIEGILDLNDTLESRICHVLGYDAREDIFGIIPATTLLPDGNIFAMVVLETIVAAAKAEMEKRSAKTAEAVGKYTDKYEGV